MKHHGGDIWWPAMAVEWLIGWSVRGTTKVWGRCSFIVSEGPWADCLGEMARMAKQNGGSRRRGGHGCQSSVRANFLECVDGEFIDSQAFIVAARIGYWKKVPCTARRELAV